MEELYQQYLRAHEGVWAPSSVRSERQRLNRLWHAIDGKPENLWTALQDHGSYTRLTIWTRVTSFFGWAIEEGHVQPPNPYAVWRKKNKRVFANAYVRKPCEVKYDEALARIQTIADEEIRNKCTQLLSGGLRWSESFTLTPDGYVTGKGGKVRRVYPTPITGPIAEKKRYSAVLRQLKKLGLRPHKLRSIKASDMVELGANAFELKKGMGWSSLAVAESYVNAREERVRELAERRVAKTNGLMRKLFRWGGRPKVEA